MFALYAPSARKSIRKRRIDGCTRRAHPDPEHADRDQGAAEGSEQLPGSHQQLIESELRGRERVPLLALADGGEEGDRIAGGVRHVIVRSNDQPSPTTRAR